MSAPKQPILPIKGKRNILITSALPYVNNVPHLGNIIGCVLSADVFARFCRLRDYNTLFICGTDEYGTATETKAIAEGLEPKQICDKYHAIHKEVYDWFNISFDYFGRTSTEKQTEVTQEIFWACHKNGFITQKDEEQWYCESCDSFLADRFVEGTCPDCGYTDARGDQCDECGHPLHAHQLKDPRCKYRKDCGKTPQLRTSTHLYLCLDKLQPEMQAYFAQAVEKGVWSANAQDITQSWFDRGLEPRAITRDLKWGTPVPLEGFTDKVFYVWFDATIGYISITANYTDEWQQWWRNPDDVQLYQFMAKDNVLFHSIIFPSSLIGTRETWTKVNHLSATEYLNYEDRQFSKSRGVGVFGNNAQESGIPADVYRFYLLYIRPETADTHFDWADLIAKHNNELLNNLGNFVHRALTFSAKFFDSKMTQVVLTDEDKESIAAINEELSKYIETLEKQVKLRDGLRHVLAISRLGNQIMQTNKPWAMVKEGNLERAGSVISLCCNISALLAVLIQPYMPDVADSLAKQLNFAPERIPDEFSVVLPVGHAIGEPATLFTRIDPAKAEEWSTLYGGVQKKDEGEEAPPPPLPENEDELRHLINEQAELVRKSKAEGIVDKSDLTKMIHELKRRKAALAAITGETMPDLETKKKKKKSKEGGEGQKAKKQQKKKYDGPHAAELKRLGQEVGQQAKALRDLRVANASEEDCAPAETKLAELKEQLASLKLKIEEEEKAEGDN